MITRTGMLPVALMLLGGCTATINSANIDPDTGYIKELPEGVVAIAARYQDLQAVRLMPQDGCYWYRHKGPVETTMLPLRSTGGNPICTRAQS